MRLVLDSGPVGLSAYLAAVNGAGEVVLSPSLRERLKTARAVVDDFATRNIPVYGLNTGLGGNLGYRIAPADMAAFQSQMLLGRSVGVGEPLPERVSRAALLARVIGASKGAAGLSPAVLDLMLAMLNRGLSPVIPSRGSIGAGDLTLGAHMGAVLIGEGEIWVAGERCPAAAALAANGLEHAVLGPKDALALANHSAVTVAMAALTLAKARRRLLLAMGAAVLAGEGYGMNLRIFDPRLQSMRPAAGQEGAAAWFLAAFAGSGLHGAARSIQDALSFRTMAPVFGTARGALDSAEAQVAIELDAAADNPVVLGNGEAAEMMSSPNFHTPVIALAFDTLAIALVHVATSGAQRIVKLMAPQLSGLPKYLSPLGGSAAGYMPMQKTVAALLAEIRLKATPASLDAMPVSEMVEDVAPQTPLAISKLGEHLSLLRWLTGIEAVVAAQAIDLRKPAPRLGVGAARLHQALRSVVLPLEADRATGQDIEPAVAALETSEINQMLSGFEAGTS